MKNLWLSCETSQDFGLLYPRINIDRNCKLIDICYIGDVQSRDNENIAILTSDGLVISLKRDEIVWSFSLATIYECDTGEPDWFSMTNIESSLVCLSKSGAIVTIPIETGIGAEIVGEFENGIDAASWSPDQEILLILTTTEDSQKSVLLSMNTSWEVLAEAEVEKHCISSDDQIAVSLCWRPDGTLCAMSAIDESDSVRKIRFYKRETLECYAIGRVEDGSGKLVKSILGTEIAWAGTGNSNVLAAVQRKGSKTQQVIFFEPNGMQHREFLLRGDGTDFVIGMNWNVDSSLLAIALRSSRYDKVQLWHRSNYHWYLKQEMQYEYGRVSRVKFSDESPVLLLVMLTSLVVRTYEFLWHTSDVQASKDGSAAFVIDGCQLNITELSKALVPPPMFAYAIMMDQPISGLAFTVNHPFLNAVASLSDGRLALIGSNKNGGKITMIDSILLPHEQVPPFSVLRHLTIVDEDPNTVRLLLSVSPVENNCDRLVELSIEWKELDRDYFHGANVSLVNEFRFHSPIKKVVRWSDTSSGALIELSTGHIFEYSSFIGDSKSYVSKEEICLLLEPCPWIAGLKNMSNFVCHSKSVDSPFIIGLSSRGRLFYQDLLLADSVSSFYLSTHHQFLCYTTSESRAHLHFLPLESLLFFDPLMGSDESNSLESYLPRAVERNSRLVAVLGSSPAVVLQMPRGNIECVYPRALMIPFVMTKIIERSFHDAFRLMRKQKIDLNLLVDLNPTSFLNEDGLKSFIAQVNNVDDLNLFISGLQNYDSREIRYNIPVWFRERYVGYFSDEDFNFMEKVNIVCQKLRSLFLSNNHNAKDGKVSLTLPVLSTFAKENPPRLDEALSLIKKIAFDEISDHILPGRSPLFSDKAQSNIQYLAFLSEYEMLFNAALAMYDFEIARAVARNSQIDPKLYLPLLQKYEDLPHYYSRFEVDVRLEKYDSALKHLHMSNVNNETTLKTESDSKHSEVIDNSFNRCFQLIENHGLHAVGIELFRGENERRKILLSLSSKLIQEKEPQVALSILLSMRPIEKDLVLNAAEACSDWRTYFDCFSDSSNSDDLDKTEMRQAAHKIAENLRSEAEGRFDQRNKFMDASRILLDYGKDVVASVEMLLMGFHWKEAYRIGRMFNREDLVLKVKRTALQRAIVMKDEVQERSNVFDKAIRDFNEARQKRKTAIVEGGIAYLHETGVSETGSVFSVASRVSDSSTDSHYSSNSIKSASSVRSVESSSTVISVKSTSSFSITGHEHNTRHKSKYNQIGREKKKKKKSKGRSKVVPGSQEELRGLVESIKVNLFDKTFCQIVAETISFLIHCCEVDNARDLYQAYSFSAANMNKSIVEMHSESAPVTNEETAEFIVDENWVALKSVESEVQGIVCESLPKEFDLFFSYKI